MDKYLRATSRIFLFALILFELLNEWGFLNFTLHFTWLGLFLTSLFVWAGLEIISLFLKRLCGQPVAGWIFTTATASIYVDALGDIFNYYGHYGWYDQTAHFLGGAAAGAIVFSVIFSLVHCGKFNLKMFGLGFFTLMVSNFLGVLYEFEEYFEDYFTGSKRLGDGPDTVNDIFLNTLGALIIILFISLLKKIKYPQTHNQNNKSGNK